MNDETGKKNECTMGEKCEIAPSAVLGKGCKIGAHVIIHPNVVLYDYTEIGDNVEIFENSVIGRPPKTAGNLIHQLKDEYKSVVIGSNTVIGVGVVIYAENHIANNVLFGDYACLRECCVVEEYCVIARFVTTNHNAIIRHHSKIMDYSHINKYSVIEDNVFIGVGIITTVGGDMRLTGQEVGENCGVKFKSGCKVGSGAIFLPGVTVGENALVGAGALVIKDVPPNTSVIEMPSKHINGKP
jgi:acetyltransferase-like isoleucine patch superfamily enzyme